MLNKFKIIIRILIYKFGLEIHKKSLLNQIDDPFFVLSKLLDGQKIKLIVDGGASIGDTSARFSSLFPHAVIHAFEPFPKFYNILKKNCSRNLLIKPHDNALSDTNGQKILNINKSEGTNSLLNTKLDKNHHHHDLLTPVGSVEVKTITLDELFPNAIIDILKLDLQGGEFDALIGAKELISNHKINSILCEIIFDKHYQSQKNGTELLSFIESNGFSLFNFYQCNYHQGKLIQADALFFHKSTQTLINKNADKYFMQFSKYLNLS